jgi:FkbM family methyltransferase
LYELLKRTVKRVLASKGYQIVPTEAGTVPIASPPTAHNLQWLKKYNIQTFIDIGAYIGEYVEFAQRLFPGAVIYAFEPLKDGFAALKRKEARVPGLTAFNYALGDEETTTQIYRSSYPPSSSLLKMASLHTEAFPHSAGHELELIRIRRLDDVFQDLPLRPNIFVKIDTQGYEDRVIEGGRGVLSQTNVIQIETSFAMLYEDQALFDKIYNQLHSLGFSFHGVLNQIYSPNDGSILQAHAYFIK